MLLLARSRPPIGQALELIQAQLSWFHLEELKHVSMDGRFGEEYLLAGMEDPPG